LIFRVVRADQNVKLSFDTCPIVSTPSPRERAIDGHVLVDVLKWGIDGRKSGLRRTIARQFAKADPEYEKTVPPELSL
jgi:hypothetical protein